MKLSALSTPLTVTKYKYSSQRIEPEGVPYFEPGWK